MGKQIETTLKSFDGGMNPDVRDQGDDSFALSYNLDTLDNNKSLKAKKTFVAIADNGEKITRFLYAKLAAGGYRMYGLGQDTGGQPKVFIGNPPVQNTPYWDAYQAGTVGAVATNVFFEYKDYLYFWQNGTILSRKLLTGGETFTESYQTISYTNVAQPVRHSADDIAYFFSDNKVHKLNDTSWTSNALTLPSDLKIVGGAEYGNYLAILCSPIQAGTAESVLFLWDRDSSLSTISAKVKLGVGEVYHIGSNDTGLFITQIVNTISAYGANYNEGFVIKHYNGFLTEKKFNDSATQAYFNSISLSGNSIMVGRDFYFPLQLTTTKDNVTYNFIMSAKFEKEEIIITANQSIDSVSGSINGIYEVTGQWYVSHSTTPLTFESALGSTFADGALETHIYATESRTQSKQLLGATVTTDPLDTGESVNIKYRIDEQTSWTTILTADTDDDVAHHAVNEDGGVGELPTLYKEIQFRLEGSGGTEITGFSFKEEVLEDDRPY